MHAFVGRRPVRPEYVTVVLFLRLAFRHELRIRFPRVKVDVVADLERVRCVPGRVFHAVLGVAIAYAGGRVTSRELLTDQYRIARGTCRRAGAIRTPRR